MSFNLKKYSQMDLSEKRFDPSLLEGATPEEKIALISEYLDQNIGDAYQRGELTDQDIYKLLSEKAIAHPNYPILDQYRKNIAQLRSLGQELIRRNGGDPNDENSVREAVGSVVQKVLDRINTKFVPQLVDVYSSSTRTEDKMRALLDVKREELIPSIQRLISQEIIDEKKDVVKKFREKVQELSFCTLEDILLVVNEGKVGLQKLSSKLSPENLDTLAKEVKRLNDDVNNKPNRYWNKVLSQHRSLPQEELAQWQRFQYTPVDWSLKAILRESGFDIVAPSLSGTRYSPVSEIYSYFYPEYQDNGQPFGSDYDRKQYALRRLSQLIVDNDYNSVERIANVLGAELVLSTDKTGLLLQGYFRNAKICNKNKSNFFADLDAIGLSDLREKLQSTVYEFKVDERYSAFNEVMRSTAESKVLATFREKFNLDPIPFSTALPAPEDCPTNENIFKIDFLLPADVLDGFKYVDGDLIPIIRQRVVFVGEYFGEDRDNPQRLADKNWLNPDGTPAYWFDRDTKQEVVMQSGQNVPVRSVYALRSRWKIATIEALGHMIGTGGLALKRKDINNPKNIIPKLDAKNIIYLYEGGTPSEGCTAVRALIKNSLDHPSVLKYANSDLLREHMDSKKTMLMNIMECAIVNVKMAQGLKLAKQEFLLQENGFNRQNLHNHNKYMNSLMEKRNKINVALSTSSIANDTNKAMELIKELDLTNSQIQSLQNSPLKSLKEKLDEILISGSVYEKINKLQDIKNKIENDVISPSLEQVRVMIRDIDQGVFSEVNAQISSFLRR